MKKAKTFAEALEILNDDLSALNDAVDVAVAQALTTFAEGAERDARALLNRPHWLLSRKINSKVKQYRRTGKTVAVLGAERTTTGKPKKGVGDPGVYAGFHESGVGSAPAHFLRRGKAKNVAGIPDNMARAFEREVARVAAGQKVKG